MSAHRGGSMERLENSMSAFENAVNNGMYILEMDVHLTKDGQVVVSHDESLARLTGEAVNIQDVDYADFPPTLP